MKLFCQTCEHLVDYHYPLDISPLDKNYSRYFRHCEACYMENQRRCCHVLKIMEKELD